MALHAVSHVLEFGAPRAQSLEIIPSLLKQANSASNCFWIDTQFLGNLLEVHKRPRAEVTDRSEPVINDSLPVLQCQIAVWPLVRLE